MVNNEKMGKLEKLLKKQSSNYSIIKKEIGITKKDLPSYLNKLKERGILKTYVDNDYKTNFYIGSDNNITKHTLNLNDGEYLMGVCSDEHIGDKGYNADAHNKYYDILDDRGIELVLNSGDLITGVSVYRNQHVDLNIHTKLEQAEWYIDNVPELSHGETLIIDGNHDLKNLENSFSPGYMIGDKKRNYKYLGQICADVELASGLVARLIHLRGNAYTIGYTLQKYIRKLNPAEMPNIILKGHTHDFLYAEIQNIHCLHTGTFQHGISNFAKELGFQNQIGAWIVNYEISDGKLSKFIPEMLKF